MPGVTPAEVLSNFGITLVEDPAENQPRLLVDLPAAELVEHAIRRKEGRMAVSYTHLTLPTTPYV